MKEPGGRLRPDDGWFTADEKDAYHQEMIEWPAWRLPRLERLVLLASVAFAFLLIAGRA